MVRCVLTGERSSRVNGHRVGRTVSPGASGQRVPGAAADTALGSGGVRLYAVPGGMRAESRLRERFIGHVACVCAVGLIIWAGAATVLPRIAEAFAGFVR